MHAPEPASSPGEGGSPTELARQRIDAVISWYTKEVMAARRSGDQQLQAALTAQLQACAADRSRLADAEPEDVERLAAEYTQRLNALTTA
ncbi:MULTISPECIES: hypothetical protein [Streptacidiphilus]|uniref:Uncharacterized protein n=1 Tax=Streptacidiphilus cavernicola TaxID=3342716 RepID=A0ABV6UWG5_9ACTN|nr:hypothetical protein [Streptacidiphilus jeojiense]